MVHLPKSTEFNKRIPKQKFYENLTITPQLKRQFTDQIKGIWWKHKIAATTVNIAAGEEVTEIEVFEIKLSSEQLDEAVLRQIDKEIPYHLMFLLECDGKHQAWIGYKEATTSGTSAFKVTTYYHTEWMAKESLPLSIEGLNLDAVYENFVRQIAGDSLPPNLKDESLKDTVERTLKRQQLEKEIERLDKLARAEKQPKKKFEFAQQIRKLQQDMEALNGH